MIEIPPVKSIDFFLQFGLTCHQFIHHIGIFIDLRFAKAKIECLKLLKRSNCRCGTLFNYSPYCTGLVHKRILRKISH